MQTIIRNWLRVSSHPECMLVEGRRDPALIFCGIKEFDRNYSRIYNYLSAQSLIEQTDHSLPMNITINNRRVTGSLRAVEYAPLVHRYLIAHVLTEGHEPPELYHFPDRIMATFHCLHELRSEQKTYHLDCKDSFQTCELILPVAAAMGFNCEFHMNRMFPEQPVTALFQALKVHGIRHELISGNRMRIWGRLTAGTFIIPSGAGSGFLSGLLMALVLLPENSVVMVDGVPESMEEIAMTLMVLQEAGIYIDAQFPQEDYWTQPAVSKQKKGTFIGATFKIQGNQRYRMPILPDIEGDWALASYFLAAGAVCGGPVTMAGLKVNTFQKASRFLDILKVAGATIEYGTEFTEEIPGSFFRGRRSKIIEGIDFHEEQGEADYIRVTGCWSDPTDLGHFFQRERLHAFETDLSDAPEILPAALLIACAAQGISCIHGIHVYPEQEWLRTGLLIDRLEKQGIMIWESEGSLYIEGYSGSQPLSGGKTDCFRDDRIAMLEGVASCISSSPVLIENAEAVEKSYPAFFEDLVRLQNNS